jgi:hypothetical protein
LGAGRGGEGDTGLTTEDIEGMEGRKGRRTAERPNPIGKDHASSGSVTHPGFPDSLRKAGVL